jgi:uncharacterized membrane protein YkvA (DUF1232 family)
MDTQLRQHESASFPHDFLDFLPVSPGRRHHIGSYALEPRRLETFNRALHALSPEAPALTLDQIATAGGRALARHADGAVPPFVASRMGALERLQALAADAPWSASPELLRQVDVLVAYRQERDDLIPDEQPVVGLLDDAVLVDVALQLLRGELADYEDFCRFRRVAAQFSDTSESGTGVTRAHWLEAILQAHSSLGLVNGKPRQRYVPDPRTSLFHIT